MFYIYLKKCSGCLFRFRTLRMGVYSKWALNLKVHWVRSELVTEGHVPWNQEAYFPRVSQSENC